MKKLVSIALFFFGISKIIMAQNKQVLYEFDQIPQTLLLNPGSKVNYKFTVGNPLLSGIYFRAGLTEITVSDFFKKDGVDANIKFRNALNRITVDDYIQFNSQIEVLNGGFRLDEKNYISAGFYTEIDIFGNMPKDILTLLNEGNAAYINKRFLVSQVNLKADASSVLHFGVSRKVNEKLNIGTRLKIYSGVANLTSTDNRGSFTTRLGQDNIYRHYLNGLNLLAYSSGFYSKNNEGENEEIEISSLMQRSFLGGNLGLGIDIGFSYQLNEQTELTASLLDLGFVSYSKDNRNFNITGSYFFSGIDFKFDGNNPNYWEDLSKDFQDKVPLEENSESYSVMRPFKFNASIKHKWGKTRTLASCHDMNYNDYFMNGLGAQLFSISRPTGLKWALTGFYERRFLAGLMGKLTYTIDDFSYTNIGAGLSAKMGKVNLYTVVDNIFGLQNIADTNSVSFQIGMNLIFR